MALMRAALLGLVASCFVALCTGACYRRLNELVTNDLGLARTHCLDENDAVRKKGETWQTNGCMKCSCSDDVVSCCDIAFKPMSGFPSDCEPILDLKKCVYTVVKKKNHSVTCPITGPHVVVGK